MELGMGHGIWGVGCGVWGGESPGLAHIQAADLTKPKASEPRGHLFAIRTPRPPIQEANYLTQPPIQEANYLIQPPIQQANYLTQPPILEASYRIQPPIQEANYLTQPLTNR